MIHAGKLWNGLSETLMENVDITISARITAIAAYIDRGEPRRQFVDASNLTVIPGMWIRTTTR